MVYLTTHETHYFLKFTVIWRWQRATQIARMMDEGNVLFNDALKTLTIFYGYMAVELWLRVNQIMREEERNILFKDALTTFLILLLY